MATTKKQIAEVSEEQTAPETPAEQVTTLVTCASNSKRISSKTNEIVNGRNSITTTLKNYNAALRTAAVDTSIEVIIVEDVTIRSLPRMKVIASQTFFVYRAINLRKTDTHRRPDIIFTSTDENLHNTDFEEARRINHVKL